MDRTRWASRLATAFTRRHSTCFFLWGTMTQKVHTDVPNTRDELLEKILNEGNELQEDKHMIRRAHNMSLLGQLPAYSTRVVILSSG